MTSEAGQDWTGSLSPTFQILINKVIINTRTPYYGFPKP